MCAGYLINQGADEVLSTISSLPYEGRASKGRIIIAPAGDDQVSYSVRLASTVDLRDARAVRKLVEATGPDADLIINDGEAVGFGALSSKFKPARESVFIVDMVASGHWELSDALRSLLTVRDGIPTLPFDEFDEAAFVDLCGRFVPDADVDVLLRIVAAGRGQPHGTMMVFSSEAAEEAN